MLKIGFCINSLEMGGAERLLVDIINALYETKDYEIHLLTKIKSNSYFYNLIKNKVKYSFLLEKKAKGFFHCVTAVCDGSFAAGEDGFASAAFTIDPRIYRHSVLADLVVLIDFSGNMTLPRNKYRTHRQYQQQRHQSHHNRPMRPDTPHGEGFNRHGKRQNLHNQFSSKNKWDYKRSRYSLPNWQRLPENQNSL